MTNNSFNTQLPSAAAAALAAGLFNNSSGYNTFDDGNNSSSLSALSSKEATGHSDSLLSQTCSPQKDASIAAESKNSNVALMHILNSTRQAPTANLIEITTRFLVASIKWAKKQRNLVELSEADQHTLIRENISELLVLHMAETKTAFNECK